MGLNPYSVPLNQEFSSKFNEMYAWFKNFQAKPLPGILYRGTVKDNVDPGKLGRVLVLIDGLTNASIGDRDQAKWCWTLNSFGGGQEDKEGVEGANNPEKGQRYGAIFPHPIGSKVFVLFEPSQDPYENAVVIGGFYQAQRIPDHAFDRRKDPVPRAWGFVSPKGHSVCLREEDDEEAVEIISHKDRKIVISDKKDQEMITILAAKGAEISIYEGANGTSLHMHDAKGDSIGIDETTGNITIQAREGIQLNAKTITFQAVDRIIGSALDINFIAKLNAQFVGIINTGLGGNETVTTNVEGMTVNETALILHKTMAPIINRTGEGAITDFAPIISLGAIVNITVLVHGVCNCTV